MATFLNDTFTGTSGVELSTRAGETGATWTLHPFSGSVACNLSDANRLRKGTATGLVMYYASGTPASADYEVTGVIYPRSNIGECGVIGRSSTTQRTCYELTYIPGSSNIRLSKRVDDGVGTPEVSLTYACGTLTLDQAYTLTLRMVGSAISAWFDGVERISVTDTEITAAGVVGTFMYEGSNAGSNTTHVHLDSITASDIVPVDKAIWELTALTAATTDDLLAVVDDPAGTPTTKKLTLANFLAALTLSNVVVQTKTVGSGTYTPTAGMKKVWAIAVGGGGAGAGGINTDSAGGGGGGGGTVIRLMTAADIGASKAYVVGAAGAATTLDTAGALMNAGAGQAGTAGATFSAIGISVAGGAGGTATNGNLNIPGHPGDLGIIFSATEGLGGMGGSSVFGFGGKPGGVNAVGGAGTAYGGGGAGGHAAAATDKAGGAGAAGILYLIEFV